MKTNPAIGSSVDKGSQVKVFVGRVGAVNLPKLAGKSQQDAVAKIEQLGLPNAEDRNRSIRRWRRPVW